jgi:c(7)-type cytochrome triheme protein
MRVVRALAAVLLSVPFAPASAGPPSFPEFPVPHRFGSVVLDNFSTAGRIAPVTFEHWRHRLLYTCRLCHVDVGFAMEAGATQISATTNRSSLHCGACHNGTTKHRGTAIFPSCSEAPERPPAAACARCHRPGGLGREAYEQFARKLPRDGADLIDWEEYDRIAFEQPADFVPGVSLRASRMKLDKSFVISISGTWLGDIAFSHQKHTRWIGCEGCHPEIFPSTSRGATSYRMKDIIAGESCGVCHTTVAFPIASCLRCHRVPPGGAGR